MSEYQYYEFQAIDRPLTQDERAAISQLSSRVKPTATSASFTYSYGDFHGDPKKVLAQYFDVMYYIANWGTQQLAFRFPKSLIDRAAIAPYCIEDCISLSFSEDWAILDWQYGDEEGFGWIEGEGALSELVGLRQEILQQDYRGLYLAWLKAITLSEEYADIDPTQLEPPIPPGLHQLSPAQKFLMNPENFLEQTEVTSLILALNQWAIQVKVADDRQQFLESAGIDTAFLSNLRLDNKPNIFAQALVAAFKTYRVSNQRLDYHPMVRFLKHLCELAPIYQLADKDVALFTRLVERGEENLKALTVRNAVGRIESPKGTGIGTGVLIDKNLLLTCDHIFSKSRAQQAWVRFNYTPNSYGLDSDVFELNLNSANRSSREDYALIPVKGEPKQQTAISIDAILDSGQEIRLIHHPQGQHVIISELGQVVQVGEDYIDHNISTDEGSSGAPIFNRDWQLVAIHRGHPGTGAGRTLAPGTTSGVPLHTFWTQIQPHLS